MFGCDSIGFTFNPLTAGPEYIRFLIFSLAPSIPAFEHGAIKRDINSKDFQTVDLLFCQI